MQAGYSFATAIGAVALGAALAAGGGLCGLFDFPGRRVLQRALVVPLLIPPWFYALIYQDRYGISGLGTLVLVLAISSAPLFQLFLTASIVDIPSKHFDMLRVLGRGAPAHLVRHVLPLGVPALAAAAVLAFLLAWGDGASARILAVPTLTVGMYDQWFGRQQDAAGASFAVALVVASLVPTVTVWALVARKSWAPVGRLQRGSAPRVRLSGLASSVPWLMGTPLLISGVVLPGVTIAQWCIERIDRVDLVAVGEDTVRTLLLALGGTLIAVALAIVLLRDRITERARRLGSITEHVVLATFAIPGLVLALAFLWLLPEDADSVVFSAVNSTPAPLCVAMGMRFCAVALFAGEAALLRTTRGHADVLRVHGRTSLASFVQLFRPFMMRPLMAGACFVLLECMKDLSLSLVLQPFGFTTIAIRMFQYSQTQRIHDCAVWIVCLILIGAYPLSVLARLADAERGNTIQYSR